MLDAIAWYGGNSEAKYQRPFDCEVWQDKQDPPIRTCGPQPVRGKRPNARGLYDMLGNVWEWTGDWKANYSASPPIDFAGPNFGNFRVIRGGSWSNVASYVRAAFRNGWEPDGRVGDLGFRVVRPAP